MSVIEAKYKIFNSFLDGVLVINSEKKILFCNKAVSTLLDIPLKRIKYDTALSSLVSFEPEIFSTTFQGTLNDIWDPTPYCEIVYKSKSGKTGQVQVSMQREVTLYGEEPMWILYLRDVTLESTLHSKYHIELEKKEAAIEKLEKAQKKLKDYSQTLEKKVEQRTADLANSNQKLTAMVNSLGQAFVIVDKKGICSKTYSKVTLKILETDPSEKPLASVLKIPPEQEGIFQNWLNLLLDERISFEDLVHLGPKTFSHSQGKHISLEFHPIREAEKLLTGIVVVATDKSDEIAALRQAEQEQINAKRILKLTKYKDLFWPFVEGATKTITDLRDHLNDSKNLIANMEKIKRWAHTLKGEAGLFWISSLAEDLHDFENLVNKISGESREQRVATTLKAKTLLSKAEIDLKEFLTENEPIVGQQRHATGKFVDLPFDKLQLFHTKLQSNKALAKQFEDDFLKEPIGKYFSQYDDLVASLASKSGKLIYPIAIKGEETRIFVADYFEFLDSFVHLITNTVDHGIETPEVRSSRGKDPHGTVSVSISEKHGDIQILIEDDGGGIDPNQIREKLLELGIPHDKNESDTEIIQHIFDTGFSSAMRVSVTSGRGIGLTALLSSVKSVGGELWVESTLGKGTKFKITLPTKKSVQAA